MMTGRSMIAPPLGTFETATETLRKRQLIERLPPLGSFDDVIASRERPNPTMSHLPTAGVLYVNDEDLATVPSNHRVREGAAGLVTYTHRIDELCIRDVQNCQELRDDIKKYIAQRVGEYIVDHCLVFTQKKLTASRELLVIGRMMALPKDQLENLMGKR